MANQISSRLRLLLIFGIVLVVSGHVAKAQNNSNNSNTNTNATNVNAGTNNNTSVNANSNANANANQNQNTNTNTNQNTNQTTGGNSTVSGLFQSYWYPIVVSGIFVFLLGGFASTIMRAIRFSKFTFNNPLGLPDGSLRAVLAFVLVSFLGFYVLANVLGATELRIPDSLLGIIATVIGFYFGSRAAETRAPATVGSVEGSVLDNAGSPALGATIELSQTGKKFTQTADLNGKFKFDNVPIGDYDIQATLTGKTPSDPAKVKVTAGGTQTVNLKLQ
jgi:hypothetical protein